MKLRFSSSKTYDDKGQIVAAMKSATYTEAQRQELNRVREFKKYIIVFEDDRDGESVEFSAIDDVVASAFAREKYFAPSFSLHEKIVKFREVPV